MGKPGEGAVINRKPLIALCHLFRDCNSRRILVDRHQPTARAQLREHRAAVAAAAEGAIHVDTVGVRYEGVHRLPQQHCLVLAFHLQPE